MKSLKNFPERLKSARKMNGCSLQALADRLNNKISKQALSKYEAGQSVPDMLLLSEIARALNLPQDYFYRTNSIELGTLSFRKLTKLSSKDQDFVIYRTRDFLERYLELEDILGIDSHFINPVKGENISSISDIESIADKLRKEWNFGEDAVFNVIELLEDLKIKVCEIDIDPSFSGMSTWVDNLLPVIVLNNNKSIPLERKRFTALHELGHLLLKLDTYPDKEQEGYCNAFAGAMLIPGSRLKDLLGGIRQHIYMNELFGLKKQYGISIQSLIYRARSVGLISESYFKLFMIKCSKAGYRKQEPFPYVGFEASNRFKQLLLRAVAEEFISTSKGAVLNNQKLTAFRAELV